MKQFSAAIFALYLVTILYFVKPILSTELFECGPPFPGLPGLTGFSCRNNRFYFRDDCGLPVDGGPCCLYDPNCCKALFPICFALEVVELCPNLFVCRTYC